MSAALRHSFNSLEVPNYRRYFAGQLISLSGTWMQTVAAIWVILTLTDSGVAVGLTTALQFLPMLLIGAWGGLLADRIPKRRLLIATQALMAIPALGLFAVTAAGVVDALDGLPRRLRLRLAQRDRQPDPAELRLSRWSGPTGWSTRSASTASSSRRRGSSARRWPGC